MILDFLQVLLQAAEAKNGIVGLLIIFLMAVIGVLVYVVMKFEKSNNSLIEFIRESKEDIKQQLAQCEKRCQESSDQFFRTINNLASKLDP